MLVEGTVRSSSVSSCGRNREARLRRDRRPTVWADAVLRRPDHHRASQRSMEVPPGLNGERLIAARRWHQQASCANASVPGRANPDHRLRQLLFLLPSLANLGHWRHKEPSLQANVAGKISTSATAVALIAIVPQLHTLCNAPNVRDVTTVPIGASASCRMASSGACVT